ncbi:MAG: ParB/RepB/Spo0J family partition protein [Candidatus Omnitrophica bacterium]|nr:ParB/RepB/Spo0J family partition protein [Candidatus Omnitrophota bacterium]
MIERKVLGRGLSALIPEQKIDTSKEIVLFVDIDRIKPNPFQPREDFNQEELQDLVSSIREKGVIQPILVRRKADNFELIAGERRWRAAKLLQIKEIPVIIKDIEDRESLEISLIENIQRQELNPLEEARAYQLLINKFEFTQEKISKVVGKSRTSIANSLRLLKLPKEVQDEIKKGRISFGHGKALLEIEDENLIRRLAQDIIAKALSVRELENVIRFKKPLKHRRAKAASAASPFLRQLEELLQQALGTKVRLMRNKKRGRIIIEFYSDEDLERILGVMKK